MDEKLLAKIRKMADSPNWEVREYAAVEIKKNKRQIFLRIFTRLEKMD